MRKVFILVGFILYISQFFIANSQLKLVHPNGDEIFEFGSKININWEGISPLEKVRIDFSSDNGANWTKISDSSTEMSHYWRAPFTKSDSCLIKISQFIIQDSDIDIVWSKTIGGSGYEHPSSIIQTQDGGFVVVGTTESKDGDFIGHGNKGNRDSWVAKLDSSGELEWLRTLGGQRDDFTFSIIQTKDNGFIVAGYTNSDSGDINDYDGEGPSDYWLFKLKSNGELEWSKTYGGKKFDTAYSVSQMIDGGFIIAGSTTSEDGDLEGHVNRGVYFDIWILKLDYKGDIEWSKTFGGTGNEHFKSSSPTNDGGLIITVQTDSDDGDVESVNGLNDFWIFKLNSKGEKEWSKTFGGTDNDIVRSAIQTFDNGFILTGSTKSLDGDLRQVGNRGKDDLWVIKLNAKGDIEWSNTYGGTEIDEPRSIIQTIDKGYLIAGKSTSDDLDLEYPGNKGGIDSWILKLKNTGDIEWSNTFGGNNFDEANSVIQTSDGNYVFTGSSMSNDGDLKKTEEKVSVDTWIVKFTNPVPLPPTDYDISDNFFSIVPFTDKQNVNELELLSPKGGEKFETGINTKIRWDGISDSDTVKLSFSSDHGKSWSKISDTIFGLEYSWKVPQIISDSCLISIEKLHNNSDTGEMVWSRTFGGTNEDRVHSIIKTNDGGFLLVGYSYSIDGDLTDLENNGSIDVWIIKLNKYSQIEWSKNYGGSGQEVSTSVIQTIDNGYIVACNTTSNDGDLSNTRKVVQSFDVWLMRLTEKGEIIWSKNYGGRERDFVNKIIETTDGGYLLACESSSKDGDLIDASNQGNKDIWLLKLSISGNIEWSKTFGGSDTEQVFDVLQINDADFLILTQTNSYNGDLLNLERKGGFDTWLLKVNNTGELVWSRRYGGTRTDNLKSMIRTNEGGYIFTGTSSSEDGDLKESGNKGLNDIWVLKLDSLFEVEWSRSYGGTLNEEASSIINSSTNSYIFTGMITSIDGDFEELINKGGSDILVSKLNETGDIEWLKTYGGSAGDFPSKIIQIDNKDYIIIGNHNSEDGDFSGFHSSYFTDIFIMNVTENILLSDTSNNVFSIVKSPVETIIPEFNYYTYINDHYNDVIVTLVLVEKINLHIEIFDNLGRRILNVFEGEGEKGLNEFKINFSEFQSGRYYVRLTTPTITKTEILEVVR